MEVSNFSFNKLMDCINGAKVKQLPNTVSNLSVLTFKGLYIYVLFYEIQ